jgi:hypothetical protein
MPNWYAAHVVMAHYLKSGPQRSFLVFENIFLLNARSWKEASAKAERLGREEAEVVGDCDGSLRVDGKPAVLRFAGVRQVVECDPPNERPADGDEVSYNELRFASARDVDKFANGRAVSMRCGRVPTEEDRKQPAFPTRSTKSRKNSRGRKDK